MSNGSNALRTSVLPELTDVRRVEVLELVDQVRARHGIEALSDDALEALTSGAPKCWHGLIDRGAGPLDGYVQLRSDESVAEAVMSDVAASSPVASELLHLLCLRSPVPVRLWVRGSRDPARRLLGRSNCHLVRELWRMEAPVPADKREPPARALPVGFSIRTFDPETDASEWLAANRLAFDRMPDQREWSMEDLRNRADAQWFRPEGFFLLVAPSGQIAGFHWVKVHEPEPGSGEMACGEVYVLAVLPAFRGRGLAEQLTRVGLDYMRSLGLERVILYVDASNEAAVRVYERLGFRTVEIHEQYELPVPTG